MNPSQERGIRSHHTHPRQHFAYTVNLLLASFDFLGSLFVSDFEFANGRFDVVHCAINRSLL